MARQNVLVLGATGYIGSSIAATLRRAGHDVWCLVRSKESAGAMALQLCGCRLFVGDAKQPDTWTALADKAQAIVFATNLKGEDVATLLGRRDAVAQRIEGGEDVSSVVLNKTVVYTSGCLVYGADTSRSLIDENSPLSPLVFVSWRPITERKLLSAALEGTYIKRAVVIRPGFLYGLQGGYLEAFRSFHDHQKAEIIGEGDNCIPTVHVEDLADLYLRAVENPNASGCYNACSDSNDSYFAIVEATARAAASYHSSLSSGGPSAGQIDVSVQHRPANPSNAMDQMLSIDLFVSSERAHNELGWVHRHASLVEEADIHFNSWLAYRHLRCSVSSSSSSSGPVVHAIH